MKYKALVSRMLTMADESIQIIINDTDDFTTLKEYLYNALKLCDNRANIQMSRLFEDTNLTDKLSFDEYTKAQHAASLVYPTSNLPIEVNLGENAAIEFAKTMSSGEVVKLFIHEVESYEDLSKNVDDIFKLIDNRLLEVNERELAFLQYFRSLPYETQLKISMIMDILYGRNTKENVESRLTQEEELPNGVYIKRDNEV